MGTCWEDLFIHLLGLGQGMGPGPGHGAWARAWGLGPGHEAWVLQMPAWVWAWRCITCMAMGVEVYGYRCTGMGLLRYAL